MKRVKGIRPDMKFAINMMYEAALKPDKALAWLSQDLDAAVERGFDYYAVMAYHRQMGEELSVSGDELAALMGTLVKETLMKVGNPDRALIKLQIADWKTGEIIPYNEMKGMLGSVRKNGATSLAFVPYRREFDLSRLADIKKSTHRGRDLAYASSLAAKKRKNSYTIVD
jgi:biofilm PGA synthesis lipoprotein PgaB